MDAPGPLGRTGRGRGAGLLQAIAGYDPKDPLSSREPVPDYRARAAPTGCGGFSIGIIRELTLRPGDRSPKCGAPSSGGAARCERLGAVAERSRYPSSRSPAPIFMALADSDGAGAALRLAADVVAADYDQGTRPPPARPPA